MISIISVSFGMKTVGFSAAAANALRLHLPIGAAIALFIALFTVWQKSAVINRKTVVKVYERDAAEAFRALPEGEQALKWNLEKIIFEDSRREISIKVGIQQ